jgi:hypothetical protein
MTKIASQSLATQLSLYVAPFCVDGSKEFHLKSHKTHEKAGLDKDSGEKIIEANRKRLNDFQARLYAQDRWSLLLIFQGMDAAGKDSAIKSVFDGINYAKKSSANPIEIDPVAIDRFARLMREQLLSGDVAARKAYLSSVVDAIIVSEDKIRIIGSNGNIRSTFGPKGQPTPRVRKSVQEWCPGAGSNHRHCDFQSHALPTELPGHFPAAMARERRFIVRLGGCVHLASPSATRGAARLRF